MRPRNLSAAHRSMLPWALDRHVSDAAALSRRPDVSVWTFRLAVPNPLRRPRPEKSEEGKDSRPCLAPASGAHRRPEGHRLAGDGRFQPEGWCAPFLSFLPRREDRDRSRSAPILPEGSISAASHNGPRRYSGMPVDLPRKEIHRVVPRTRRRAASTNRVVVPEGTLSRPSARSEEQAPVVRVRLSFLPRSPAYMRERSLAAHSRSPEGDCSSAHRSRVASRGCCVEPIRRTPEGIRANGRTGGHPKVVRYRLAVPATPASWRAGLGPDSHLLHRNGQDAIRKPESSLRPEGRRADAEAPGVRLVPHIPPAGGDPPRAPKCSCRDGPWPIPGEPDRSRARFCSVGAEALSELRLA